jgi:hypothetical protein
MSYAAITLKAGDGPMGRETLRLCACCKISPEEKPHVTYCDLVCQYH